MTVTPCIIYARFSSAQQERGSSIERQLELARAHIAREGWTEIEFVEDRGRSAWKGDHLSKGNLGLLTKRIMSGEFEPGTVILVEKLDRLSRQDRRITRRWLEDVTDLGMGVATVDGGRLYTAKTLQANMTEDIEILIRAELAWKESQQKSERIMDAQARNRAKAAATGKVMSARCPGWLRVENGSFIQDAARVALVQQIFQWTADGVGARTIAKRLNDVPVETWGKARGGWEPTYISEIINSPAVEGDHQPRRLVDGAKINTFDKIVGYYPRIIAADLVTAARSARKMRQRSGGGHRMGFRNLFQSVIRCASCGSTMTLRNGPTPRANLICSNVFRGRKCEQKTSLRYRAFEDAALTKMLHLALDSRYFSRPDETRPIKTKIAELEKLVVDLTTKSKRMLNLIVMTDEPDPTLVAERQSGEATIKTTKARIESAVADLELAQGAVNHADHMLRVLEVQQAITDPDDAIRQPARMKVSQAIQTVVERIECDTADVVDGVVMKTYTMTLVGGIAGFKFNDKGALVGEFDLTGHVLNPEAGPGYLQAMLGVVPDPSKVATMGDFVRRRAAAA